LLFGRITKLLDTLVCKVKRDTVDGRFRASDAAHVGRPSNTGKRRAEIVDALLRVTARDGLASATTARVADEARLSSGLVHYHFANMEEILVAAVETLASRIEARSLARLASAADAPARSRLHAYVEAHVALGPDADARALAAWVAIGAEAMRSADIRKVYGDTVGRWYERIRGLVREALREEGRATRNAATIAAAILSAIEGAFHIGVACPGLLPVGYAAPTLRRTIDALLDAA
jgi:TetR/AcrR family transcriptional repressor of bet genes